MGKHKNQKENNRKNKKMIAANESFSSIYQEDALPVKLNGKYRMVSCLKYSEEKKVYLIQQLESEQLYILKCRQGNQAELLEREYDMLCQLRGYHVPEAFQCFTEQKTTYLIREYVIGKTIEEKVEKQGVYEKTSAIRALLSVCEIVGRMHSLNPPIVHRDIKPQNILERDNGEFCLIDLDTAREYKMDGMYDTIYVGTRITAAPEQFGYSQTSVRSDIYSLGVLFLYMLTGGYTTRCREWQELPREYRSVINKCLAFDPKNRYRSVSSLMGELKCLLRTSRRRCTLAFQLAVIWICIGVAAGIGIHMYTEYRYEHETYHFANEQVEEAVRASLGIEEGVPIQESDLAQVTTLILCGNQVFTSWEEHQEYHDTYWSEFGNSVRQIETRELSDLDHMTNLSSLVLDNQGIYDLSFLNGHELNRLSICKNQLSNLDGIEACPHIRTLIVKDNPITDAEALEELDDILTLGISSTHLQSLDSISNKHISSLDASDNPPMDYGFLDTLPNLENLLIGKADKATISKINQRTNLRILGLYESDLESLDEIKNLTNLENLDITASKACRDISGIGHYPYLDYFCISHTNIEDISGIRELSELEYIDLTNAPVSDVTPIKDCPRLRYVFIDSGKEGLIERLGLPENVEIIVNE